MSTTPRRGTERFVKLRRRVLDGRGQLDAGIRLVAEAWRGRGVGSQLVADAERLAASQVMSVSTTTMLGDAAA